MRFTNMLTTHEFLELDFESFFNNIYSLMVFNMDRQQTIYCVIKTYVLSVKGKKDRIYNHDKC